ncbi:unnamed protein product [Symbiodinium microadriaticum]|nr:unnamed protein product [Symbiodinium microadriaticum]
MSPTPDDQVKRALYTELCRATRPVAVQRIVWSLQKQELVVDNRDATVVVQRLGKCSLWDSALDAVMRLACPGLLQPDAVLLGAMVTACGRGNAWTQSLLCLDLLAEYGLEKGIFTVNAAANACLESSWPRALELLRENAYLRLNTVSYNILLGACERGGIRGMRDSILLQMHNSVLLPSLVTYNSLITLCGVDGDWKSALQYLKELRQSQQEVEPDIISYNTAVSVCGSCSQWQPVLALFGDIATHGLQLDAFSLGAAIAGAAKSRRWRSALSLLQLVWPAGSIGIRPNVVVCSSACDALAQGRWERAVGFLADMVRVALLPNAFTISSSIGGCGRGQQWAKPLLLLRWMGRRTGLSYPERVSATIGACAQAKCWQASCALLQVRRQASEERPGVLAYNAVLGATASSEVEGGAWKWSLRLFWELSHAATSADIISFNSVINACQTGGCWPGSLTLLRRLREAILQPDFLSFSDLGIKFCSTEPRLSSNILWVHAFAAFCSSLQSRRTQRCKFAAVCGPTLRRLHGRSLQLRI